MSATAIKGLMDIIEARFTAVLAKQDDTIRILEEGHAAEIRTLNGKIQTLTDELSVVKIMPTPMAASVAHQQQQPQQGSRNPNPPFQPTRPAPELDEEEFPSLPTSEWKVREGRYTQRARKRREREEEVAKEKEQERREREKKEKEREHAQSARGPPSSLPRCCIPGQSGRWWLPSTP
jgi:hypothetical protein